MDPKDEKTNTEAEKCYTKCAWSREKCREKKHSSEKFVNTNLMQHPKKMQDAIEQGEEKQYEVGLCVIR